MLPPSCSPPRPCRLAPRLGAIRPLAGLLLLAASLSTTPVFAEEPTSAWPAKIMVMAVEQRVDSPSPSRQDPETLRTVLSLVSAGLQTEGKTRVMTQADIRTLLTVEAQAQLLGCSGEECATALAGSLATDYLVTVALATLPTGGVLLSLHALEPGRGRSVHRVSTTIRITDDFTTTIERSVGELRDAVIATHLTASGAPPRERSWLARRGGVFWGVGSAGAATTLGGIGLLTYSGSRARRHNLQAVAYRDWVSEGLNEGTAPDISGVLDESEARATSRLWGVGLLLTGVGLAALGAASLFDQPLPRFATVSVAPGPANTPGLAFTFTVVGRW